MSQAAQAASPPGGPVQSPGALQQILRVLAAPFVFLRAVWRQIRAWRRIRFTSGGLVFSLGATAVGLAAMNTGNNLLYLLMGAMLGFITVSSWLSEQAIGGLRLERRIPRAVTVGRDLRLTYHVRNVRTRLPSMAVELTESGLPNAAFVAQVPAGGSTQTRSHNSFVRRGIYKLGTVTLSTSFPFGMFLKARDVEIPGEVVVWPRVNRPVRTPSPGGGRVPRMGASAKGAAGTRGEYRSLREYRPGDDPKDIHWRSSARLREPVIREYERDGAETRWIVLDTQTEAGDPAEVAVEVAASLLARAASEHRPFALVAGPHTIEPGEGPGHLELCLDALARVDFDPRSPAPSPPVDPMACVLVGVDARAGFGDVMAVGRNATFDIPVPAEEEAA